MSAVIKGVLALGVTVLAMGRYWDVTVRAVFGRDISLYWDIQEGARLLDVAFNVADHWTSFAVVMLVLAGIAGLYWTTLSLVRILCRFAPMALGKPAGVMLTTLASGLVIANTLGLQASWPFVSKPVLPVYADQIQLIWTAASANRLARALPASPPMTADLAALEQADVKVLFLESYGVATYDVQGIRHLVEPARQAFARAVSGHGLNVVSAFVTPPTFAGGSGLSHMSLLAGIDTALRFS